MLKKESPPGGGGDKVERIDMLAHGVLVFPTAAGFKRLHALTSPPTPEEEGWDLTGGVYPMKRGRAGGRLEATVDLAGSMDDRIHPSRGHSVNTVLLWLSNVAEEASLGSVDVQISKRGTPDGWLRVEAGGMVREMKTKQETPPGCLAQLGTWTQRPRLLVYAVAFSSDSCRMAAAGEDEHARGAISVMHLPEMEEVHRFHTDHAFKHIAFAPGGILIAATPWRVFAWDLQCGKHDSRRSPFRRKAIAGLTTAPRDQDLKEEEEDKIPGMAVWAAETNQGLVELFTGRIPLQPSIRMSPHACDIRGASFSPTMGHVLLTLGDLDRQIVLSDVRNGSVLCRWAFGSDAVPCASFGPTGSIVIAGGGEWKTFHLNCDGTGLAGEDPENVADTDQSSPPLFSESTLAEVFPPLGTVPSFLRCELSEIAQAVDMLVDDTMTPPYIPPAWDALSWARESIVLTLAQGHLEWRHPQSGAVLRSDKAPSVARTPSSLVVSPDGRLVAIPSHENGLWMQCLDEESTSNHSPGHTEGIWNIAFLCWGDERHVVTMSHHSLLLWNVSRSIITQDLGVGVGSSPVFLAFAAAERAPIVSVLTERGVFAWNVETHMEVHVQIDSLPSKIAVSPDGSLLVMTHKMGLQVHKLWESGSVLDIEGALRKEPVTVLCFSRDMRRLFCGGADGLSVCKVGDDTLQPIHFVSAPAFRAIRSFSPAPNGMTCVCITREGQLRWYDLRDECSVDEILRCSVGGSCSIVTWSPTSNVVAVGSDNVIFVLDKQGRETHTLVGHAGKVTGLSFSENGSQLASCSFDTTAMVWDLTSPLLTRHSVLDRCLCRPSPPHPLAIHADEEATSTPSATTRRSDDPSLLEWDGMMSLVRTRSTLKRYKRMLETETGRPKGTQNSPSPRVLGA